METWVIRKMGTEWNPEKFCPYSGKRIHPHAYRDGQSWRIMYYREDGICMRCRNTTAQELAWLIANPAEFEKIDISFKQWLEGIKNDGTRNTN